MPAAKDLGRFRHRLPYASEIYGVCQPLLGWRGRQCGERVDCERIEPWRRLQARLAADTRLRQVAAERPQTIGPGTTLPPRMPGWPGTAEFFKAPACLCGCRNILGLTGGAGWHGNT
jgi:hypothetical protein